MTTGKTCAICSYEGLTMTLSDILRRAISKDGRMLPAIAAAAGISKGQVYRFVRGQRELTLPAASKLAAALGLTLRPVAQRRRPSKKGV